MSEELIWEDPPADARGYGNDLKRRAMKDHPGKWLLYRSDTKDGTAASRLKDKGFEAVSRRNPDKKTFSIYARWPEAQS